MIEILFSDLNEAKQAEILAALGDNGNYDIIPIAMLIEPGGDDSPDEPQKKVGRKTPSS